MYGDPNYKGRRVVHCDYAPADVLGYSPELIEYVKAQYCGLVTLVDTWFGKLMDKLDALGMAENTAVMFISDHGTNFCDNPRNVIGKPPYSMYPGLMHLPFLVRLPDERHAGETRDEVVYNLDMTATAYDIAGIESPMGLDGRSVMPIITGDGSWEQREYVTCRYADSLCYIDDDTWVLASIDGKPQDMFDLQLDPECRHDATPKLAQDRFDTAWNRLLFDAAGHLPRYGMGIQLPKQTDAIGQAVVEVGI